MYHPDTNSANNVECHKKAVPKKKEPKDSTKLTAKERNDLIDKMLKDNGYIK